MKKRLRAWFRDLVSEQVVLDVHPVPVTVNPTPVTVNPTPVHLDADHIAKVLVRDVVAALPVIPAPVLDADAVAEKLSAGIEAVAREMIAAALKPPPKTLKEDTLLDPEPDPSAEAALLAKLPTDIQYAVRYSCRKVQNENPSPSQGTTLGNNWHRNEACEWAKTWLRERGLKARDTDINLGCELYYRVYILPGKVKR